MADTLPTLTDYVRLYTGDDGQTHFEDVEVPLVVDRGGESVVGRSSALPAKEISFVSAPADWDYGWHRAPRRQFVLVFRGAIEVEIAGGETRRFEPGTAILADDTTGQGHLTRSCSDEAVILGIVPLAPLASGG